MATAVIFKFTNRHISAMPTWTFSKFKK